MVRAGFALGASLLSFFLPRLFFDSDDRFNLLPPPPRRMHSRHRRKNDFFVNLRLLLLLFYIKNGPGFSDLFIQYLALSQFPRTGPKLDAVNSRGHRLTYKQAAQI